MGAKMCIDAHLIGKNTLAGFRSLFTFTGVLFICMNNSLDFISKKSQLPEIFEHLDLFTNKLLKLPVLADSSTPVDLAALPTLILHNLSSFPRLFRQASAESYLGKDTDLNI